MNVVETSLPGVLIIEPKVWGDERGYFFESFQAERYQAHGIKGTFVQDNVSYSRRGILRGLHMQNPNPQGKLVQALHGAVLDVAVDVRVGSPHFGRSVAVELSSDNKRQLWVPPGFAHGFIVTSETAMFAYKCTDYYAPASELSILWNDPDLEIPWPRGLEPQLSAKDKVGRRLKDISPGELCRYVAGA